MTIGIDISALQGPHRMRGIGFAILNFINNISDSDKRDNKFVFFVFKEKEADALELLKLDGMSYEIRYMNPKVARQPINYLLSARWRHLLASARRQLSELKDRYVGNSLIKDSKDIDVFIQPDQSASLPRGHRKMKKVLIIYDIIPYVLEWEYLWSYKTARVRGFSRKAALRCAARRWFYIKKLRVSTRRANTLLAISKTTKDDFMHHVGVKAKKIKVIHLGISSEKNEDKKDVELQRYHNTSWGYMPRPFKLNDNKPFILYVGGADRRRRIDELITAFNNLRGEGIQINLVLSGDSMQGPENIATQEIQGALKTSSYLDDIIFTGFTTDTIRNWLYKNCLAFVYPSTYEGFGLPVLEAMAHGCPVICYPNSAVKEVAADLPIYAQDHEDLRKNIKELADLSAKERQTIGEKNKTHAQKFSWAKTSKEIIAAIAS